MTRILVTSSRMPFALDEIRKLGRQGHDVYATDTFARSPGSHSKYVRAAFVTPSPRFAPEAFVARVRELVREHEIDLVVPTFEEVFYLARAADELGSSDVLFAPEFDALALLHDKARFIAWAAELGLAVPRTRTVTTHDELARAIAELPEYFARPVFSRGGVSLLTNTGPLAGALALEDCHPSPEAPWIVQEFVHGEDVCSFSVIHHGRVAAHSTYVHPRMLEHAGGITFESVVSPETLAAAQTIAEATRYHGQMSLDFMRTERGLVLIECNPRPTAGVYVMSDPMFVDALLRPDPARLDVAPAGTKAKIGIALVRDMLLHLQETPKDVAALFSGGRDVYADPHDFLPALYGLLANGQVRAYRRDLGLEQHRRTDLAAAYFHDISWDGPGQDAAPPRAAAGSARAERLQSGRLGA